MSHSPARPDELGGKGRVMERVPGEIMSLELGSNHLAGPHSACVAATAAVGNPRAPATHHDSNHRSPACGGTDGSVIPLVPLAQHKESIGCAHLPSRGHGAPSRA